MGFLQAKKYRQVAVGGLSARGSVGLCNGIFKRSQACLDAGGTPLLARITRRSADQLAITPGQALWAQIKTVALLPNVLAKQAALISPKLAKSM